MGSFANLSANLNLNIQNFSRQLRAASNQANTFAANLNGRTVASMRELNKQTNAWGLNMKSVSRVVSGIVISQAFYAMLQNIRQATAAVWEFAQQLEYAQIAYSNLFGDTQLATEFINVLKDFAALTPFGFVEAEKSAKRLLAYGIEYKNVMYVMQGVLTASAAQGDSMKIEQISRALGQIYTYGKLMTAEVRQLTEAGIPVFDILQEKLGLTQEQLRNLGREAIPASVAINAIVDGINERFGNVLEASSKTLQGIISNIKDNATMLFAGIFEPLTVMTKSALYEVGQFFYNMRELFEVAGTGGVFEAIFPPELHGIIRQLVANVANAIQTFLRFAMVLGNLLKPALLGVIAAYNALAPAIQYVGNLLLGLVYTITNNATAMKALTLAIAAASAMWVVFKARAIATTVVTAVITGISKALAGLAAMLTFVMAHPFWALLIGITGVVVGLSVGFGNLSNKVNSFFKSLTQFNGVDPDKILLPSQKDRANDLDKFNEKLGGTSDAMDDLADSTGKATKAAKGLLSFDEVFKLNEPDEGAGAGKGIDFSGLEDALGGFGGLGDAFIPEIPDFSDYISKLTEGFLKPFRAAWEFIKEHIVKIASTAIGAGLGAALGLVFGGPLGAKIGAIIGGLVGFLWGKIADKLGVAPTQHLATLIGGAFTGALLAAASFIKNVIPTLVPTFTNGIFSGFSRMVGSFRKGLVKTLRQGILGAVVSIGVGILSNALTAWIANELSLTEKDLANAGVGQMIGSIAGTITGFILGGPVGSLIGGALGQLAGSIIGEFWAYLSTVFKGSIIGGVAGLPIGALVGTLVGSIGGPLGAALGAAVGTAIGAVAGLIVENWDSIAGFFVKLVAKVGEAVTAISNYVGNVSKFFKDLYSNISKIMSDIYKGIAEPVSNIFNAVSTVLGDIWTAVTTVITDIFTAVSTVLTDIFNVVYTVWTDVFNAVSTFLQDIWSAISTVWNDALSAITTVVNGMYSIVSLIWGFIRDLILSVCTQIYNVVNERFGWIFEAIRTWITNAYNTVVVLFTEIFNSISTWLTNAYNKVYEIFSNIFTAVSTWLANAYEVVTEYFANIYNKIKEKVRDSYNEVKNYFKTMYEGVKTYIEDMYDSVKEGTKNMYNKFKNFVSDLWSGAFSKLFGWLDDAISKLRNFFDLSGKASKVSLPSFGGGTSTGHATGGIFDREHIARFAEGNKAEAVIPLENASAMQPFVDAISRGIIEGIAPSLMSIAPAQQASSSLPPLYVGTLIADDRGLKQLYKKFEIIQTQENARKGLA